MRPIVIAHRGASAYAPEHTHAAWELALRMGADYIEQDLQMTRDGVLVVLHDETLDRTARGTGCTGRVATRDWSDIRHCDVGRWFDERPAATGDRSFAGELLPALADVLDRYAGRARFYIETKKPESAPGMEAALVDLLRERDLAGGALHEGLPAVYLQSFSAASLRLLAGLAPNVPRVQLMRRRPARRMIAALPAIARYASLVGPPARCVTSAFMDAARDARLEVHPYTANEDSEMARLLGLGVHGMFTDRPDVLRALIPDP